MRRAIRDRTHDDERRSTWGRGSTAWDGEDGDDVFDRATQAGGAGWADSGLPPLGFGYAPQTGRGGVYGPQSGYAVPGTPVSESHFPHADWTQSETVRSGDPGRWHPARSDFHVRGTHAPDFSLRGLTTPNYGTQGVLGGYGYGPQTLERGGPFRGRGPKGYRRSDERILEDVCERLTEEGELNASGIDVRVSEGEVILTGTVPDRRSKRLAEDVAGQCEGVDDVRNELRVADGSRRDESAIVSQSARRSRSQRRTRA